MTDNKKKKNSKKALHDYFFQDVYSQKEYSLDLFRLVFTKEEFRLFNWKTLKTELTTFIDSEWKQKRMDVAFSVQVKSNNKKAKIILLLEHKSRQEAKILKQLLDYQARICVPRSCGKDGGGPSALNYQEGEQTTQSCIGGKACVVSVWEKAVIKRSCEFWKDERKRTDRRGIESLIDDVKTGEQIRLRDKLNGNPEDRLSGIRCIGGMIPEQAL